MNVSLSGDFNTWLACDIMATCWWSFLRKAKWWYKMYAAKSMLWTTSPPQWQLMRRQCKPRIEQCCSTNVDACIWLPKSGCVVHCIQFWCLARVDWCEWLFTSQELAWYTTLRQVTLFLSLFAFVCAQTVPRPMTVKTIRSFFFFFSKFASVRIIFFSYQVIIWQ